jgi:hypothetical protein
MSGALAAVLSALGQFLSTITVGTDGANERGYDSFAGLYGSLAAPTAFRGNTISGITWNVNASGHIKLYMSGTGKANSDSTFASLRIAANAAVTRASAGYTSNDGAGNTLWTWSLNTTAYPNSGTAALSIA